MKKTLLVLAMTLISLNMSSQWKEYPHTPDGSLISFSVDEGRHSAEPIEWWYTAGHLTGDTTGKHFSYMLTYFYYPYATIDGFRILNISDDDNNVFYSDTQYVTYPTMATDKLDIQASLSSGTETWKNKYSGTTILPFQYEINAASPNVTLNLDYDTVKRPLILGDDGYFDQGSDAYTYYYSQTGINVLGSITYDGVTENITGTSWIDRQYGTLNPSEGNEYEWFSIQLSNGMDINLWHIFNEENQIPNEQRFKMQGVYFDENTQYTNFNFELERLEYAFTADNEKCYAQKWHLTASDNNVDIIISTLHSNSEVESPFRFYEGSTTISGTVNGSSVTGYGFAELLHSYEQPIINMTNGTAWNNSFPIQWEITNPDEGNPLTYDLAFSVDGGVTYTAITSDVTATSYAWSSSFSDGDTFIVKVKGASIDDTLVGEVTKEFTYDTTAAIDEIKTDVISLYPNPTSQTISIRCQDAIKIDIINLRGQIVKSIDTNIDKPIDVHALSQGVYIVSIRTQTGRQTERLIIK